MLINGKDYDLRFGLRFLEEAQNVYCKDGAMIDGEIIKLNIGWGANMLAAHLKTYSAPAIASCILCATAHLMEQPTIDDIDTYIVDCVNKGETIPGMCERFLSLLLSAPLCREGVQRYLKTLDAYVRMKVLEAKKTEEELKKKEELHSHQSEATVTFTSDTVRKRKSTS